MVRSAPLLAALLASACLVGPDYERPRVELRGAYRGAAPPTGAGQAPSLGDLQWSQVFQDPPLQGLIRTALAQNLDLGIAAARIEQAAAQLGITRADQLPTVSVGASAETTGGSC